MARVYNALIKDVSDTHAKPGCVKANSKSVDGKRAIAKYIGNENVTLSELNEVRLEETHQTLGILFESEGDVMAHLHDLCYTYGNEWEYIDTASIYNEPETLNSDLHYLGDNVWYQAY